jgi:phosphoglycerate dehydrogenase-like enzyme
MVYDPYFSTDEAHQMGVMLVSLDELVQRCDVVSLNAPSNSETFHILNAERLQQMKDDALIVNTARGSLIDEQALIVELSRGRLFAFLDVTDPEPPAADSPLRYLPNVVVTPHVAGCIEDCTHLGRMAVEELRRFFAGEPALHPITPNMLDHIA